MSVWLNKPLGVFKDLRAFFECTLCELDEALLGLPMADISFWLCLWLNISLGEIDEHIELILLKPSIFLVNSMFCYELFWFSDITGEEPEDEEEALNAMYSLTSKS